MPYVTFRSDLGGLVALYLVYWPLERILSRAYHLAPSSYEQPIVAIELLRHFYPFPILGRGELVLLSVWIGGIALSTHGYRTLFASWSALDAERALRPVALTMVGVIAWAFSTYDFNLYLDQGHLVDRALLLTCGGLAVLRPVFILPLTVLGLGLMGQFQHPLGGFSPSHFILPFHALMLFLAAMLLRAMGIRLRSWQLLAALLSLVAAGYLRSGVDKLWLGWPLNEQVHNILFATYANGWLGFLSVDQISAVGRTLAHLNPVLVLWTLVQELGVLALFWGRRTATVLLVLGACFHIAILSVSGIFFWMWIATDLVLALQIARLARDERSQLFSRRMFVTSLLLLPAAVVWFQPATLSWLDVRVSYTYRFDGVGESGHRYSLPPLGFAPYEYGFTLGDFDEYVRRPLLDITWGAADLATARAVGDARTAEAIEAVEQRVGRRPFDADRAEVSDAFIRRWLTNRHRRGPKRAWPGLFKAPYQLITFSSDDPYRGSEAICQVEVRLVSSLFDGLRYMEFRNEIVRVITVSRAGGCR